MRTVVINSHEVDVNDIVSMEIERDPKTGKPLFYKIRLAFLAGATTVPLKEGYAIEKKLHRRS